MPRIDIDEVVREKLPRHARYIPRFVRNWLKRTIHEKELNEILAAGWNRSPQEFIRVALDHMGIGYRCDGVDKLDPEGRYLFAANHPFGGMDGMMIADALIGHFGDVRVVVNDLLSHIEPLEPIWLPVNKYGRQRPEYALRYNEAFDGRMPILTFPAGLCSRRKNGVVSDLPWRLNFLKRAHASGRQIVPVYVEGQLSDFFYGLAQWRERLGVKFNIELLWLPDEMFRQSGSRFRIVVGEPIDTASLSGSLQDQADNIRNEVYRLQERLTCRNTK